MRIGLIGAGAVAPLHAAAAAALPGLKLTAVCDLVESAAAAVARPAGAQAFLDYRDLLDSGLVDAVIVNTPHGLHRQMAEDAADRGLHVLCEKPLATSLADCDAMIRACEEAGVVLNVGHIQHFLPEKRVIADVVGSGDLGPVRAVHDLRATDYRPGTRPDWFFSREMAGGGALMNIGVHCVDRSIWLGGAPAVSVAASTSQRYGVPVETDGLLRLQLAGDVSVSVSVLSGLPRHVDQLTVVCEGGVLVADPRRGTTIRVDGRTSTLLEFREDAIERAFRDQLADFTASVEGNDPAVSTSHARHVVEVVMAAYVSAADSGGPVLVPVGA